MALPSTTNKQKNNEYLLTVTEFNQTPLADFSAGDRIDVYQPDGIPKTDLSTAVQTSLDKADSALQTAPVTSVAGKTGAVTLNNTDVGLGNVGNFKAVSTAANQGLTSTEKGNARDNIDAITSTDSSLGSALPVIADSLNGVSNATVGQIVKIKTVDANGNPTSWENVDEGDNWELIEKIIVGYSITTSEPADWSTNWTDYFINTGTAKEPIYTAVTGTSAPTWVAGTYYDYALGTSNVERIQDTEGNYYSDIYKDGAVYINNTTSVNSTFTYIYRHNDVALLNGGVNAGDIAYIGTYKMNNGLSKWERSTALANGYIGQTYSGVYSTQGNFSRVFMGGCYSGMEIKIFGVRA